MERKRQNATEKRLAQVRALKGRHFKDELSVEEQLRAKDAAIALLETEVAELQQRLRKAEKSHARPEQEQHYPNSIETADPTAGEKPSFDFYRD